MSSHATHQETLGHSHLSLLSHCGLILMKHQSFPQNPCQRGKSHHYKRHWQSIYKLILYTIQIFSFRVFDFNLLLLSEKSLCCWSHPLPCLVTWNAQSSCLSLYHWLQLWFTDYCCGLLTLASWLCLLPPPVKQQKGVTIHCLIFDSHARCESM